jgi:tRNA(Ile)-lysidine synthase TilS/MesJ
MQNDMRDTYENYTRNQRYAAYKDAATLVGITHPPPVFMGHNEDDTIENILTNVAQKKKFSNLYGMQNYEILDSIAFCRPLLQTSKADIYTCAHRYAVPHLPDSTLGWSQRGKIRTTVLPALLTWESRIVNGLHHLAKHLQELTVATELQVDACVSRTSDCTLTFPPYQPPPQSPTFWRMYLAKVTNNTTVSTKAIRTLTDRIARSSIGKMPLKKTLLMTTHKNEDGSWVFSWEETPPYHSPPVPS